LGKKVIGLTACLIVFVVLTFSSANAQRAVTITKPETGSVVESPVEICFALQDLETEPARNGVNEGKGHHHLLMDLSLPTDWKRRIKKNVNHTHLGNGDDCKTLHLDSGKHTIRALFGYGNHKPYYPPLTDTVVITVK